MSMDTLQAEVGKAVRELAGHQKTLVDTLERQQHELNDIRAQRVPIPPSASQSVAAANEDRFGAMGEASPFTSGQDPPIQLPVNAQQGAGGLASAMPNTAVNASSSTGHGVKIVLPDGTEIPLGGQSNAAGPKVPGSTQLDALQRSDKWLPSMPVVESNRWKSRMEEILGMEQWLDSFCNWLSLISEPFCTEVKFSATSPLPIDKKDLSTDQISRSSRLMAMLRQTFQMTPRAKIILLAYVEGPGDKNGYEALRRIVQEYMIKTRAELMHFRTSLLGRTFKAQTVTEVIKQIEFEESRYNKLARMLPSNVPASDLALLPSDLVMVLIKSLPVGVREYVVMRSPSHDYVQMKNAALLYEANQRTWTEIAGSSSATYMHGMFDTNDKPKGKGKSKDGKKGKGKAKDSNKGAAKGNGEKSEKERNATCFRCGRTGHFSSNCHAKKDKDGKPLEGKPAPKKDGKGSGEEKGSSTGPQNKGKGKGSKGKKVNEMLEQPEGESWPTNGPAESQGSNGDGSRASAAKQAAASLNPILPTQSWFEDTIAQFEREQITEEQFDLVHGSFLMEEQFSSDFDFSCFGNPPDLWSKTKHVCTMSAAVFMPMMPDVPSDLHWWLIDSGASASVVSSRFLKHYEVVKNQVLGPATGPGFSSASGETIHPTSLVCLKAFFRLTSREDPSDIMLKECLVSAFVADVPNNVLSVGSLLRKGWSLSSSGSELEVCFGGYNLDLVTWQNVPWIFHEVETVMDFSDDRDLQKTFWSRRKIHDGPVNTVEHLSETDKSMLMTTKRQPDVSLEELDPAAASSSSPAYVSSRPVSDSESPYRESLSVEPNSVPDSSEPFDYEPYMIVDTNTGFASIPSEESSEHPAVLRKRDLNKSKLEQHRRQGHFPFHADCLSCQAAKSTTHHRRKKKSVLSSEIACDFFFLNLDKANKESFKYLIMVDLTTGMKGVAPVQSDIRLSHRWIQAWLGEFNMSTECPEPIEIITDAEEAASSFMKGAINHRPASFVKVPPQGHQTIGGAEAGVRAIKDAFNTLRQDLRENGCDVCVRNQTAVNAALAYLCHCSNYFSCYLDTKQSPKSLALGRETTRKTTMFGSLVLAEVPASLKKDCISRFEKATYLRPEFNSLGDVVCTVIGGQERFFVCKSFKIVSPLEWDVSLSPSVLHFFDRMQPDVSIEDLSAKMSEPLPSRIIEPVEYSNVKNVPSSWIHEHGRTKGCSVCARHQSFHGLKHNRKCIDRYIEWLRRRSDPMSDLNMSQGPVLAADGSQVRRLSGKQKPPPGLGEADQPVQQRFPDFPANREKQVSFDLPKNQPIPESLPVEGGQHLDENPHDVPYSPSLAPSSPKALDEPEVIHDMEVDDSADGMVDLSEFAAAGGEPTATEAMELDLVTALDNFELSYLEERHIGMLQSVYQIRGVKPKSSKANLCGEEILLLFPGYVISDANGQYLDKDLAYAGMHTEIDSMTSQKVGRPIHEQEAQRLAKQWQISIITCRWVCVEKDPLNVRMRLVAREMAKGKSSARDLMVSSPTSSIESLRILIAEAAVLDLVILGLDISAAFMASPLGRRLGKPIKVILKMPPNTMQFPDGSPIFLEAFKAINGLRTSGLAWVEHLSHLLQELGIKPSLIETTVFSGEVSVKGHGKAWVQVVAYVDDLLVFAPSKVFAVAVQDHLALHLKVKRTGLIERSFEGGGSLRFLGRNIERKSNSKEITISLDENYLDGMFEAYSISTASINPPDLRPILEDSSKSDELSPDAAMRYRAALGKLSWMSQTYVFINVYIALLATGMATPQDRHEKALRSVWKFMKSQRGIYQRFPSPEATIEEQEAQRLVIYCDASWAPMRFLKRRSISGACVFYRGSIIKAFTRLQQVVVLSSCESELSALAESFQESMGIKRISEHLFLETHAHVTNIHESFQASDRIHSLANSLIFGLVDEDLEHATAIEVEVRCDSQAAIRVLTSPGLQRRSRHVELRICFCQEMVRRRTIILTWVEGSQQIADILTKCLGMKLFLKFRTSMGFIESAELPAKLADQQSESQTKQTAKKKKGKTNQIQSILYGGRPESVNVQSLESNSQDEEHVLASTVFVPDAQKSDPSQFASQPLSLILETQEANLPELSPSKFSGIFLEICCGVNSNLAESIQASFCGDIQMAVVRVSTRADFTMFHAQLSDLVQRFSKKGKPVYVHFSLQPSGNSDTTEYIPADAEPTESTQVSGLEQILKLSQSLAVAADEFTFELPKRNRYWNSKFMADFFVKVGRHIYAQFPRLCSFPETDPKVGKIFLWLGTHPSLARSLANHTECNCESHVAFNAVNWDKVSHYPASMCSIIAQAYRDVYIGKDMAKSTLPAYRFFEPGMTEIRYSMKKLLENPV